MSCINVHTQFVPIDFKIVNGLADLSGNSLKIFTNLMSHFPRIFPSIRTIQKETGLCRNTVFKWLRFLEKRKLIKRVHRSGTSNLYEISPVLILKRKAIDTMKKFIASKKAQWEARFAKNGVVPTIGVPVVPTIGTLTITKELYMKTDEFLTETSYR